jgi:hypothetical protein
MEINIPLDDVTSYIIDYTAVSRPCQCGVEDRLRNGYGWWAQIVITTSGRRLIPSERHHHRVLGESMLEPMLTEIATALATKAVTGVYDLVKAKFAKNRPAQAEIAAAVEEPDDPRRIEALATLLAEAERTDPEFGAALRAQWAVTIHNETIHNETIHNQQPSSPDVTNTVSGNVAKLVQARDIHGNISL